jgi:xylulokinase
MGGAALVGIDVGTTGVKVIAISATGEVLARAEEGYPLSTPRPGWSEQDPEDWWRATERALGQLAAAGVGAPAGIGLSGQMHGLVCLDGHDRVLRPAILWTAGRTQAECDEIEARLGLDRLIALTGNRALAGFTAPKLLWLRRHEPEVYAPIRHILLPKDYVRLRLTGVHAIDVADASGTLLLDVAGRCWSDELLAALDVPRAWLPTLLESPAESGRTLAGASPWGAGIPVAAGAGDQAAAALGVGVDRPGAVAVTIGTSGVVFAALPAYRSEPQARVHVFCHAVPGAWEAMGVMLSAAGALAWLRSALGANETSYEALVAEAAGWQPCVEGLTFLPYLSGERTPHADPGARAAFAGLTLRHDRGALVRAVLEGVAYGLRDSLELLRGLGVEAAVGRVSGGAARSELWLRIVASALGLPLERTVAEEGSAFGAALLGGVAAGVFAGVHEAVAACVRVRDVTAPDPVWQAAYDEGYLRFRSLYPALRPLEA